MIVNFLENLGILFDGFINIVKNIGTIFVSFYDFFKNIFVIFSSLLTTLPIEISTFLLSSFIFIVTFGLIVFIKKII